MFLTGFLIVVVYSVVSEAEPGAGPEPWLTLSGNGGRGGAGGRVRDSCLYDFYGRCVYSFPGFLFSSVGHTYKTYSR